MDPDATAPDLLTVEDEVVVLTSDALDVARLQPVEILKDWRRKGVVGGRPAAVRLEILVRVGLCEERETDDPKEVRIRVVGREA